MGVIGPRYQRGNLAAVKQAPGLSYCPQVEAAAPFPEPPAQIESDRLQLTAPIVFRAKTTLPGLGSLPPAESTAEQAKIDAKMRSICRGC